MPQSSSIDKSIRFIVLYPPKCSHDSTTGETEIAKYWRNHYCNLLNSVKNDRHKNLVLDNISQVNFQDNMVVTASEVEALIRSLSPGKSDL